jgi:dTDP-4-amino-4,6-dideoxygalactose transaminase
MKKSNGWRQYEKIKDTVVDFYSESFRHQYVYQRTSSASISKSLEEYLDVKHVIPCANGTDALQIAMMGLI